jgi:uncharacterized protein
MIRGALMFAMFILAAAALPLQAQQKQYLPVKDEYQVFVIGDSLAAGLWSGLTRAADQDSRLSINGRYKEDSGLTRPEYYDWNAALPKILERNTIDIAVVMIGSNDGQDIRDGDMRYVFGTPEWSAHYAAQIDRLIKTLTEAGAAVYWVELPPMAAEQYDAEIKTIAAIQAERAKAAGIKVVGTRAALSLENGGYTDKGFDAEGEFVRLRARDGVHFLKAGNTKLGSLVFEAMRTDLDHPEGQGESAAVTSVQPEASGPAFGQSDAGGGDTVMYMEPEPEQPAPPITEATKSDYAGPKNPVVPTNRAMAELAKSAHPGSTAQRLFTLGEAPPPQPGRFDDFRMPQ